MPHGETVYPETKQAERAMFDRILASGRAGKSHAQIAEMIGIGRGTLKNWIGQRPEFSRIMTLADDYALSWWEGLGQRQAETREGNSSVFMFIMKNRFHIDYGKPDGAAGGADDSDETFAVLAILSPEKRNALRALLREPSSQVLNPLIPAQAGIPPGETDTSPPLVSELF